MMTASHTRQTKLEPLLLIGRVPSSYYLMFIVALVAPGTAGVAAAAHSLLSIPFVWYTQIRFTYKQRRCARKQ